MPLITRSEYHPPRLWRNPHLQTVYSSLFRRAPAVPYHRERITTPDGDFLDLDLALASPRATRVALLAHGLCGSSKSTYMRGMCAALLDAGWDVLSWNMRGCSGEPNHHLRSYHSGATEDLDLVVSHVERLGVYRSIALIGFSLGGNIVLKYLGEREESLPSSVAAAVVFSVPCDLRDSAETLARISRFPYMQAFLKDLRVTLEAKHLRWPDQVDLKRFRSIRTFHEYDERYTAPIHGFESALHYWEQCSSKRYLGGIRRPVLLVNALDDPFYGEASIPQQEARESQFVWLETPRFGGHVGFVEFSGSAYWSESRALSFLHEVLGTHQQPDTRRPDN
jgi:uncharacterized protein